LTQLNQQLRQINRALEDLKDRYSDLYENAPAMYFSLDLRGCVVECNQTMVSTLNMSRQAVVGRAYETFLPEALRDGFRSRYPEFLRAGSIQEETRWVISNRDVIDVGVVGTVVRGPKDSVMHARFVAQDVTTRKRLEAEVHEKNQRLAQANEELSRKNRELDEFVHVVSHDLQEPLRTLIAFSDFLLKDYGERLEPQGQEFVRYLVDASRRMRAMILEMLNLSRAGKVIGEFEEVDLQELTAVVLTDLRELIRSKNGRVQVKGELPVVWGDRDRIAQLLANLITNGLKYNQSGHPCVEIEAAAPAGRDLGEGDGAVDPGREATITVKDNGIGIDAQFHKQIFQLFRRLHTQEEYEGTGAGLAICSKIVQAHAGRIWVESAPGKGATFFIRLHRPPPVPQATSPSLFHSESMISQAASNEHNAS
jgi:PAS domain S-box-containing protein